VEERVAVRIDADPKRTEILHAKLPEALGHELLPGDFLDFLDLRRLERRSSADDREVDHPVFPHRLDRLVRKASLAGDRAHAVVAAEPFGEADHPGARRRADGDLLVAAGAQLAHPGRRVQQKRSAQVHRRLETLVEDPDVRAVSDPDDVAVGRDEVARLELSDVALRGRECQAMLGHLWLSR
jgi:hypothetical protein